MLRQPADIMDDAETSPGLIHERVYCSAPTDTMDASGGWEKVPITLKKSFELHGRASGIRRPHEVDSGKRPVHLCFCLSSVQTFHKLARYVDDDVKRKLSHITNKVAAQIRNRTLADGGSVSVIAFLQNFKAVFMACSIHDAAALRLIKHFPTEPV